MYTAVLMLAMTTGAETPQFGRRNCDCCSGGYSDCCGGRRHGHRRHDCCGGGGGCCGGAYYGGGPAYVYGPNSVPGPYYASSNGTVPYDGTRSYYPGMNSAQVRNSYYLDPNQQGGAMVRVLVPNGDAEVWFDSAATRQRGMDRMFMTEPITGDGNHTYTIKAHWTQDGRPIDQERRVDVRAGQPVTVDFRSNQAPRQGGEAVPLPKNQK